jgi:hypothetical protein
MKLLDLDLEVSYWTKKHTYIVKYKYGSYTKRYYPDFFITYNSNNKCVLEVKGYVDNKHIFKLKCTSALQKFSSLDIDYVVDFMHNNSKYQDLMGWFIDEKNKFYEK